MLIETGVSKLDAVVWIKNGVSPFVTWYVVVVWSNNVVLLNETGVLKVVKTVLIKIGISHIIIS